ASRRLTIHGDICLLERRHIDDFMKKLKLKTGSFHFAENRKFSLCVDRQTSMPIGKKGDVLHFLIQTEDAIRRD
ncbi:hypothetical protein KJ633_07875, partial [bacterium]|nr:hypothetical protein [bacterium]